MKTRILSLLLTAILLVSCLGISGTAAGSDPCAQYTDVNRSMWYHAAVDFALSNGIMGSTTTTGYTFEPNTPCTRSMIASILYSLEGKPSVSYSPIFPDVKKDQWFTNAVMWAYSKGVVTGYDNGNFGPNDLVTREQMAVILKSYTSKVADLDTSATTYLSKFPDGYKSSWSSSAVAWAVAKGLVSGKAVSGKLLLDPQGKATRAELAAILMSFINNVIHFTPNTDIHVALITDYGNINDGSFNQAAWEGVCSFCREKGLSYKYYIPADDTTSAREAAVTRAYKDGYNVFVLPGWLFGEVIVDLQNKYTDAYFIGLDITENDLTVDWEHFYAPAPNTVCFNYRQDQAGYLAGYAAVSLGYEHLAFLGGMENSAILDYGYGFIQGANAAAVKLGKAKQVSVEYVIGNQFWGDATITSFMKNLYRNGVEVTFAVGGGIYTSACEAAAAYGGKFIGMDVDQQEEVDANYGSGMTVTSAMKDLSGSVVYALNALYNREWGSVGGLAVARGIESSAPENNFVCLSENTQWGTGFTRDDYLKLVGQIASGAAQIKNYEWGWPQTQITVHNLGYIHEW